MSTLIKKIENLKINDLEKFPVWQYANSDSKGETLVEPIKRYPVKSMTGKIIGVEVTFSNGRKNWAIIGNVDSSNSGLTEHFITISLECNGRWFTLARYHDIDYPQNGIDALATLVKMPVDEIFPITYDISPYAIGEKSALVGKILKEPKNKLTRSEIIALAVP